jgi:hypothetical protein
MERFQKNQQDTTVSIEEPVIADIFEVQGPLEMGYGEYQELFFEMQQHYNRLCEASEKLEGLRKLFNINRTGNNLDVAYKVTFNQDHETATDEVGQKIFNTFIVDYSLDISEVLRKFRRVKDYVEAKTLKGQPPFCEVDILSKEVKEPVKC